MVEREVLSMEADADNWLSTNPQAGDSRCERVSPMYRHRVGDAVIARRPA